MHHFWKDERKLRGHRNDSSSSIEIEISNLLYQEAIKIREKISKEGYEK